MSSVTETVYLFILEIVAQYPVGTVETGVRGRGSGVKSEELTDEEVMGD